MGVRTLSLTWMQPDGSWILFAFNSNHLCNSLCMTPNVECIMQLCLPSCSDGKTNSAVGTTAGLKLTITQLPACMGVSSVEVQQTSSGIDSVKYYVNYGSQKVLLSASGNLASAVAATTFNAPAADSQLAGLTGDLRSTPSGPQMVSAFLFWFAGCVAHLPVALTALIGFRRTCQLTYCPASHPH
jgi:hypothetical protein